MSVFKDILKALSLVTVTSTVHTTLVLPVPGIGTAAAYAAADAFGTTIQFVVPKEGTISNAVFYDLDDEGIDKDLVLFHQLFTETADNSAFAVTDADLLKCLGVITFDTWKNFGNNQIGLATPALSYKAPQGIIYAQLVTRGADNIAAGSGPRIALVVV